MSPSLDSLITLLTEKLSAITDSSNNGEDLLLISKAISQINEVQASQANYQSLVDRLTQLENTVTTNDGLTNALITENDSKINTLTLALNEHLANKNNPNNVTKNQVGLNLVDNFGNTFDVNDSSVDKYALAKGVNTVWNKIESLENGMNLNTGKIESLEKEYNDDIKIVFSKYRTTTIRGNPAWRRCRIWSDGICEQEGNEYIYSIEEETDVNDIHGAAYIHPDVEYIDNVFSYTTIHSNGTSSYQLFGGRAPENRLRVMAYTVDHSDIPSNAAVDVTWTMKGKVNLTNDLLQSLNNLYG